MTMCIRLAIITTCMLAAAASAHAATCSFDEASGDLSVSLEGYDNSTLKVVSGTIQLDGATCGAATTTTTSRIVVTSFDGRADTLQLIGRFAPGRNDVPEADKPEIEIELQNFVDRNDTLVVFGTARNDVIRFTTGGLNLNDDLDEDVVGAAGGRIRLRGQNGDDLIDASAYAGASLLDLRGGAGNDTITGSAAGDDIHGEAGNDTLDGGAGLDEIWDGPGADKVMGGADRDLLQVDPTADPGDDFHGGGGIDTLYYLGRINDLTISIDNLADDGEPGENDNVHLDVEDVWGGDGDDVLVGSSADNELWGSYGNDELYGGDGDDYLVGLWGADLLVGDGGDDFLSAGDGPDVLDGGPGLDEMYGHIGADVFYNADGLADTVDCGGGIDDPEPDPLDTFIDCENI